MNPKLITTVSQDWSLSRDGNQVRTERVLVSIHVNNTKKNQIPYDENDCLRNSRK